MSSIHVIRITSDLLAVPSAEGYNFTIIGGRICCPISHEELKVGSTAYKVDCCKGVFSHGIREHLKTSKTCPLCRADLNEESILNPAQKLQKAIKKLNRKIQEIERVLLLRMAGVDSLLRQRNIYPKSSERCKSINKEVKKEIKIIEKRKRQMETAKREVKRLKGQLKKLRRQEAVTLEQRMARSLIEDASDKSKRKRSVRLDERRLARALETPSAESERSEGASGASGAGIEGVPGVRTDDFLLVKMILQQKMLEEILEKAIRGDLSTRAVQEARILGLI